MLLFTLLVTGIISLLTWSIYYSARAERVSGFDRRLKSRAIYNTQLYAVMGDSALYLLRRMDTASILGAATNRSVALYSDEGKVFYLFNMPGTEPLNISMDLLNQVKQVGEIS